jgi:hypothetical protein
LSGHEPGTIETQGWWDFLLPDFCWRFSPAERREAAVECAGDRILFFLTDGTDLFPGANLNRLWQFRT